MIDYRKANMRCRFHVSTSIKGLLSLKDRELEGVRLCLSTDDGSDIPQNVAEFRAKLQAELDKGVLLIRAADCDNFDPVEGCLGHPIKGDCCNGR